MLLPISAVENNTLFHPQLKLDKLPLLFFSFHNTRKGIPVYVSCKRYPLLKHSLYILYLDNELL